MKTTYGIFAKATTSRSLDNLPDDFTVVTTVAKPTSHKWEDDKNIMKDAKLFHDNVLIPIGEFLHTYGITVDFGEIDLASMVESKHVYRKLPHFFKTEGKNEYTLSSDGLTQYRVRRDKKLNVRGTTPVAYEDANGTIWALSANGEYAAQCHTYLDFFAIARQTVENTINHAIAENYGGHVRIKLAKIGSVAVNGNA